MNRTIVVSSVVVLSVFSAALYFGMQKSAAQESQPAAGLGRYVDKNGGIHLPEEDYRLKWVHLGSWSVDGKQLHVVYTPPEVVEAFRATGQWPPGATIVKEIRASESAKMTTGNVNWGGPIVQWFVLVKDTSKPSFPGNPNWGKGWGWALFKIEDPKKNVSTSYRHDCLQCHVPAEKTDWTFSQGYSVLHEKSGPFEKYPADIYKSK